MVIAICSRKGGTGKSLLARSLAVAALMDGRRAAVLDCDVQASCVRWAARRAAKGTPAVVEAATEYGFRSSLGGMIDRLTDRAPGSAVVLVDSPPHAGTLIREIVEAAVPGRPRSGRRHGRACARGRHPRRDRSQRMPGGGQGRGDGPRRPGDIQAADLPDGAGRSCGAPLRYRRRPCGGRIRTDGEGRGRGRGRLGLDEVFARIRKAGYFGCRTSRNPENIIRRKHATRDSPDHGRST